MSHGASGSKLGTGRRGFTLVELLVVIGIIADRPRTPLGLSQGRISAQPAGNSASRARPAHTACAPHVGRGKSEGRPERGFVHERQLPKRVRSGGRAVRVVDSASLGGRCPGRDGTPSSAVPQDLLDHVALRRLEERDDLHLTAALRTGQRVETFREACRIAVPWGLLAAGITAITAAVAGAGLAFLVQADLRPNNSAAYCASGQGPTSGIK